MSVLNRAWSATKRTARKISDKTEEVFDSAATSVKIKNLEVKVDELYEELGRIVYRDLHTEDDLEESKLETIAAIDALFDRIAVLKEAQKAKKAEKAAQKEEAEKEAAPTEEAPAEEAATE
jgi:dynactin complex subunit